MNEPHFLAATRVLVIDDLSSIHDDYRKILVSAGPLDLDADAEAILGRTVAPAQAMQFCLDSAYQGQEGLALVQKALADLRPYSVAFVDMRMPPGWDGVETIRRLWAVDPRIQVVICTAYSDYSWSDTIKTLGHRDNLIVLKKPFDHIEVQQLTHALARKWQLAREGEARISGLDQLVTARTTELRDAEHDFTAAFDANPLPQSIIALDRFEVIAVNDSYRQTFGFSVEDLRQVTPETFGRGLDSSRWRDLLAKLVAGEPIDDHAFVFQPSAGVERNMRCSARALTLQGRPCAIWVIRDVTEQLQLEEQLRHSQKMEAIGLLSAGVAHDFNNLLTVIHGFTDQALSETDSDRMRSLLAPIHAASVRAATLTRQLLLFSRRQAGETRQVNFITVLRELQPLLRRLIPEHIALNFVLPDKLPLVVADSANLEQIVVNLAVNARDAMPLQGGRIDFCLASRTFTAAEETGHVDGYAGQFVSLRVTDTGSGIPPEVLSRIFEPFFTTKEVGKGTGLGLSTVYSLTRQQGGWIDIKTTVGAGTTFIVYQPVAQTSAPSAAAGSSPPGDSWRKFSATNRVLAVEDDPDVQSVLRLLLEKYALDGVVAGDGPGALREWDKHAGGFDLLVTDMVMPNGMTGLDLARRLRTERPSLKVIITTGYSRDLLDPAQLEMIGGRPHLLMKPYTPKELIRAIEKTASAIEPVPALV
jgi:two-component system cell cycle sensor histidine kinase/response regulator CckA